MNSYRRAVGGYTILEVIIVLTVSSLLFATAIAGYGAQNRRTQFAGSVNNFAQNLQDILNDVETGFYPSRNDFSCAVSNPTATPPNPPVISPPAVAAAKEQGTNTDCTFLGKAIQFAPGPHTDTNRANVDIYTLVGRRVKIDGTPVTSIDDAKPVALTNLVDRKSLTAGVEIVSVRMASTNETLSGLSMVSNSNGISSGVNSRAALAVIKGNLDEIAATTFIGPSATTSKVSQINSTSIANASGGINICVRETNGRFAVISLAGNDSQIIVNTQIDQPCS